MIEEQESVKSENRRVMCQQVSATEIDHLIEDKASFLLKPGSLTHDW